MAASPPLALMRFDPSQKAAAHLSERCADGGAILDKQEPEFSSPGQVTYMATRTLTWLGATCSPAGMLALLPLWAVMVVT